MLFAIEGPRILCKKCFRRIERYEAKIKIQTIKKSKSQRP